MVEGLHPHEHREPSGRLHEELIMVSVNVELADIVHELWLLDSSWV